ncbi:hypothetical protein RM533_01705 [Croceicoccus sp. F390]|uniref:Uncharacterized protein n=1 Tax=Croceicoccus esteveae TaxID=3075597 RepID=A0ABU2ZE73_9SPHN|nr:hypothetical protein [Croceicoccus sp. F390]MDT0574895.1 hypothetical protein [Croceicoccus sp. F390]
MSHSPTTFHGEPASGGGIDWGDHASIHRRPNGNKSNLLRGFNVMREGTFAEMIRFVSLLPDDDRQHLVIQKAGDRVFELPEILSLSRRDDFPAA